MRTVSALLGAAVLGLAFAAATATADVASAAEHNSMPGHSMMGGSTMMGDDMSPGAMSSAPMTCGQMMATMMGGMPGMGEGEGLKGDDGPSSLAYQGANNKMHSAMAFPFTGNADVDFAKSMIPHHQGAIDMAKIVLAFGSDPEIRKLAEAVISAQESEIALMREWLSRNGAN